MSFPLGLYIQYYSGRSLLKTVSSIWTIAFLLCRKNLFLQQQQSPHSSCFLLLLALTTNINQLYKPSYICPLFIFSSVFILHFSSCCQSISCFWTISHPPPPTNHHLAHGYKIINKQHHISSSSLFCSLHIILWDVLGRTVKEKEK